MKSIVEEFGQNAGKVWWALHSHGSIDTIRLMKTTKLDEKKFYAAIGWLARENKICKSNNNYILGETNLTEKIGVDAGKVWNTLNVWGEVDISSIARITEIKETDIYSALGWLAREDKIQIQKGTAKESQTKFTLK
jgi:hypothetical protein